VITSSSRGLDSAALLASAPAVRRWRPSARLAKPCTRGRTRPGCRAGRAARLCNERCKSARHCPFKTSARSPQPANSVSPQNSSPLTARHNGRQDIGQVRAVWPGTASNLDVRPSKVISFHRRLRRSVWIGDALAVGRRRRSLGARPFGSKPRGCRRCDPLWGDGSAAPPSFQPALAAAKRITERRRTAGSTHKDCTTGPTGCCAATKHVVVAEHGNQGPHPPPRPPPQSGGPLAPLGPSLKSDLRCSSMITVALAKGALLRIRCGALLLPVPWDFSTLLDDDNRQTEWCQVPAARPGPLLVRMPNVPVMWAYGQAQLGIVRWTIVPAWSTKFARGAPASTSVSGGCRWAVARQGQQWRLHPPRRRSARPTAGWPCKFGAPAPKFSFDQLDPCRWS